MRFYLLCIFFLWGLSSANAQPGTVWIGVNGLTCSQCTRNVEMRLRKLDFVTDVKMNLQQTSGIISLKSAGFNPSAIAQAVKDAGFSLRFMEIAESDVRSNPGKDFAISGARYEVISGDNYEDANTALRFIGKDFLSASAYKKWKSKLPESMKSNTYYLAVVKKTVAP